MKYRITARFDLATTVEPEIYGSSWSGDYEDFEDSSYFQSSDVTSAGGEISFTIEAADEDAADEAVREIIYDGSEVEDSNGLTWGVDNLRVEIEALEMSKEDALVIIRRLLDRLAAEGTLSSEEREAFDIVLQDV